MSSATTTPPTQDNQIAAGVYLTSTNSQYLVESFLGEGSYGKVAKCKRMCDMKTVAIKIMKDKDSYSTAARREAAALWSLRELDSDKCNLVQWFQIFRDKGHTCLEFEHLDKSLFDYMKEKMFYRVPLPEIRPIIQQVANALHHLKTVGVIHTDLKLENVMLVNQLQEPFKVKVIDFGLACKTSHATVGSYMQTRPYRAPEIILGCPFTEAIDMWSLGCMAAAMYIGDLLYPGYTQFDMMRFIVETQGQPPDNMLNVGQNTHWFFRRDKGSTTSLWKLKSPEQIYRETRIQPVDPRRFKFNSLDKLLDTWPIFAPNAIEEAVRKNDMAMFVDMLKGMLQLDPANRITPRQVLEHQFISLSHIVSMYDHSKYVRMSSDMMKVCQKVTVQQIPPEQSEDADSHAAPAHCSSSSSSSSQATSSSNNWNQSCIIPSVKRKLDDDEDTGLKEAREDCHKISNDDRKRFRQSPASPSTSSSNNLNQSCILPRVKRKLDDDEDTGLEKAREDCHKRSNDDRKRFRQSPASPSTSSSNNWNQSCILPRVKRKLDDDEDTGLEKGRDDCHKRSNDDRKRFRRSPASLSTSSSNNWNQSCILPRVKRKLDDDEDTGLKEAREDCHKRSNDDRKRFRQSPASPSTSSSNNWNQRCVSPRVKRKLDDESEDSDQERKRDRKCKESTSTHSSSHATSHTPHVQPDQRSSLADHSYCLRTSGWTWTKCQSQPGLERKAADDEDKQHRKRKFDHWSDSPGDEFRRRKHKTV